MDVSEMLSDLGDHGFTDSPTDTKVRVLQDTIWEIEALRPWPFLEAEVTLDFDGTSAVATNLPADLRAVRKAVLLPGGIDLDPTRREDVEEFAGGALNTVGAPLSYYFEGEELRFWPVPPSGTQIRLPYLRVSADIDSDTLEGAILIPKRHHRAIVLGALVRLYDMEDDPELADRFQGHYESRLDRMVDDLFRKQYDRPEYVRVQDPDSWDY